MAGVGLAALYAGALTVLSPVLMLCALLWPFGRRKLERWGLGLPHVEPGGIWLHAASLGEGRAAAALASALTEVRPDLPLLRTATSQTAREQRIGVDGTALAPVDIPWVVRRFLRRFRPRLLVLVESELWPGWIWACRGRTPVAVVSARVGPGTRRWARLCPPLFRWMLEQVSVWTAQSEQDAEFLARYLERDIPVSGDLKAAAPIVQSALTWVGEAFVAGCTYADSEAVLLEAWASDPSLPLLILAPREPARFDAVATAVDRAGLSWARRSTLSADRVSEETRVLVLDTVGELAGVYACARAAFIGGTFSADLGGHSAAEAVAAGIPVVHGPETSANQLSFDRADSVAVSGPEGLMDGVRSALMRERRSESPSATGEDSPALRVWADLASWCDGALPKEHTPRPWAWPLVPFWRVGRWAQRLLTTPRRGVLPTIAVGGVTVGGSGKTPVALWLAACLAEQGHRPAVVARGYGRVGGRRGARLALVGHSASRNARHLGDELVLAHSRGFIAVSCPDRREGLRWAQEAGATIAVLDDGLQQRSVVPDARVLVVDGRWPTGGASMPAGQARERLKDVPSPDVLWCQHQPLPDRLSEALAGQRVLGRMLPVAWQVDGQEQPLGWRPSLPVMVVTGIAHPGSVYRLLRVLGVDWEDVLVFPDHHRFTPRELGSLRAASERYRLVTTEKDAVRLPSDLALAVLRVDVDPGEADDWLRRWLAQRWPVE